MIPAARVSRSANSWRRSTRSVPARSGVRSLRLVALGGDGVVEEGEAGQRADLLEGPQLVEAIQAEPFGSVDFLELRLHRFALGSGLSAHEVELDQSRGGEAITFDVCVERHRFRGGVVVGRMDCGLA